MAYVDPKSKPEVFDNSSGSRVPLGPSEVGVTAAGYGSGTVTLGANPPKAGHVVPKRGTARSRVPKNPGPSKG